MRDFKIRALEVAKAAEEVVAGETALPIDPFKIAPSGHHGPGDRIDNRAFPGSS